MPMMVRKVDADISLLVWNEEVGCNKKEVTDLIEKSFAFETQKDKIILIHRFILFLQIITRFVNV